MLNKLQTFDKIILNITLVIQILHIILIINQTFNFNLEKNLIIQSLTNNVIPLTLLYDLIKISALWSLCLYTIFWVFILLYKNLKRKN